MQRIVRDRRLTSEEAATYNAVRAQLDAELPELIARHQQHMASLGQLESLFSQLKETREAKGLSLSELAQLTSTDQSALRTSRRGGAPILLLKPSYARPKHLANAWS
ncbi:MAG: hypothetical protein IT424_09710 [Pirellulales bacterium]|nr:hypothetical protein [Pirellulales bacterium]